MVEKELMSKKPMTTHKELKSVKYIQQIIRLAENLLGTTFTATGTNKYSAYCPFHDDTTDSFRVRVDDKGEVRFHCFGACKADWDIYDVIQKVNGCSFREARELLARYLEENVELSDTSSSPAQIPVEPVPDEAEEAPVEFCEPKELDIEVIDALEEAATFYDHFLGEGSQYDKIQKYLQRRGVDENLIELYQIGYAPSYQEEITGQALLKAHLGRFNEDYHLFKNFIRAGLFRLLDDETIKGYLYYRQFIDFSLGIYGSYGDYFAGKITFPIKDIRGRVCGIMGRKPDNRGIKWIKQQTSETDLNPKGWLYGIDKAYPYIHRYRTV